jgi:hypothetical protein
MYKTRILYKSTPFPVNKVVLDMNCLIPYD